MPALDAGIHCAARQEQPYSRCKRRLIIDCRVKSMGAKLSRVSRAQRSTKRSGVMRC
jgi:hypothetical protein